MGEIVSAKLDTREIEALTEVEDEENHENTSEALRDVISSGLAAKGYLNGKKRETMLRTTAQRFADVFGLLGLVLLGATFWLPIELRAFVAAPFVMALTCYGLDRFLAKREPAISNRIMALTTREKA